MKKLKISLAASATVALVLTSSPAFAATAADRGETDPGNCWTDLATGTSLCVSAGQDLAAVVNEKYGVHLTVESSPGRSTDLVTGETFLTPAPIND